MPANATYYDLMDEAQKFIDNQQFKSALDSYEKALQLEPNDKTLLYNLGWTYNMTGNADKAKDFYQKAITLDSSYSDAYNGLGNIYVDNLNDYDKGLEQYQLALKYDSKNKFALYNSGRAYRFKKDFDNAKKFYEEAIKLDITYPDGYNGLGNIYNDRNDYDKALQNYELAIKYNPKHKYALYNLGRIYEIKKNWDKAIYYYNEAIRAGYQPADTYRILGDIYLARNDYDAALYHYDLSLQQDPNFHDSLINSAKAWAQKGDDSQALKFYQRAINADKKDEADSYHELGVFYYNNKNYDEAILNYEASLKKNPDNKFALYNLGLAYQAKQEYDKAVPQFEKVIKLYPEYPYPFLGVANILYLQGNTLDAIVYFEKAIASDKTIPEPYYQLANLYLDQLSYTAARENFEKCLQADPDYVYAQHNKAWIYEKLGQFKTSKEEWVKAKNIYAQILAGKEPGKKDPDAAAKFFYYAHILNNYLDVSDPDYDPGKIRYNYECAIAADNEIPYYRCMLVKFFKEQKMELESQKQKKNNINRLDETIILQQRIDEYYMQYLHHYREGVKLLKKRLESKKDIYDLNDLGEFYLTMDEYEEAANVYEEAIKLDEKFSRSYVGFGVAQSKMDNYTEAIKNFKKALQVDPDDLNVQSNLADAYLKSEKLSLAEECFKNILNVAPCHVDALIGLAEHHKLLADQMSDDKKFSDAEELLKQAAKLYNDILEKTRDFKSVSRKLNS